MKVCYSCKLSLPHTGFARAKKRADGLQAACRACLAKENKKYYEKNRTAVLARNQLRKERLRAHIWELKAAGHCSDCDNTDPRVLDFDHVRGVKQFDISLAVRNGYAWKVVAEELEKCDLRCANCHRIRTYETTRR
jgi:hypothetical protein